MNRYENCVAIRVRDCGPRPQGDKDIAVAGHDHPIAIRSEHLFKALRDVERHLLFRDPLPRNTAAIVTPVASIDHDSCGRPEAAEAEAAHIRPAVDKRQHLGRVGKSFLALHHRLSLGIPGGRSESFGFGAVSRVVFVCAAGASITPPCTATSPLAERTRRGRVLVSMKEECPSSSPFRPTRE